MKFLKKGFAIAIASIAVHSSAQNYTTPFMHSLLDEHTYDLIVGESSGDRAYNYIMDIAPYERDRVHSDYQGHFFESEYMMNKLKAFGLDAQLEVFGKTTAWDGISASLWEVEPGLKKIADYGELAATLASGSSNADVTAELVWIGAGTEDEISKLDLKDKIVVTEASAGSVQSRVTKAGAVGIVSFNSPRPLRDPLQIPNSGLRGNDKTFGFNITPRDGHVLRDRLRRGEKITVKAKVETTTEQTDNEVPTCVIKGTDPNAEEILFVAHLFEGYVKLGANDNISGAAVLLEVARTLQALIDRGEIAQPKRTIRFIWVNEFSGTTPWAQQHKDILDKTICGVNLDMVGLWLSKDGSMYCGHRTLMGNPHFVNDVQESFFHYMGHTNKGFVATGLGRPDALKPVYSATGSHDPFYYSISAHYGSSDHEVFNDWGVQVPTTIQNTWPDSYYHTSMDRPSICDPTQLHRSAVICASMAYTIANADEKGAIAIASEVASNASKRMSVRLADDLNGLNKADAETFAAQYKHAHFNQDAVLCNEKATLLSVLRLMPNSSNLKSYVNSLIASLQEKSATFHKEIDAASKAIAPALNVTAPKTVVLSDIEKKAAKIYPRSTAKVKEAGYGVMRTISRDLQKKHNVINEQGRAVVTHTDDIAKLTVGGMNSILDIKKMQDAQFPDAAKLEDIMNYLEMLKEAGLVTY